MKTRLVSYDKNRLDLAFPLNQKRMTIGRDADNSIQLPGQTVSKHHAVIALTKDGWVIENLKSKNGIRVNGKQVAQATLKNGDIVKIGSYQLTFESDITSNDWTPSYVINISDEVQDKTRTMPGT